MKQLEDFYPPDYQAKKLLTKPYIGTKNVPIPLALKVFLNETKPHMFLSLKKEWQEQWMISAYDKEHNAKN